MSDVTGPVNMIEVRELLVQLRDLEARAKENKQRLFHFVLGTCAESLDDNLAMAAEIAADNDE